MYNIYLVSIVNGNIPGQEHHNDPLMPASPYLTQLQGIRPMSCEINGLAESLIGGVSCYIY